MSATMRNSEPLPRDLKKWMPLILFLACVSIGGWYWTTRPANVQSAISALGDAANVNQVMTVEAISEGDDSLAGRHVTIARARVAQSGKEFMWIEGSDGNPLLVVFAARAKIIPPPAGARVEVTGVIRDRRDTVSIPSNDQRTVANLHLVASAVRILQ